MEMPELSKFYQGTHKEDAGFEFLAIGIDDERAPSETAAKEDKLPFSVLMDSLGKTANACHVDAIPTLRRDRRAAFAIVLITPVAVSFVTPAAYPGSLPQWFWAPFYAVLPSFDLLSESSFPGMTQASLKPIPWTNHATVPAYGLDYAAVLFLLAFWSFRRRPLTRD